MASKALSLARLLLDSSPHSLFPALRSSRLKRGPNQSLFRKQMRLLCILNCSRLHLRTPCPTHWVPGARVPGSCWSLSLGPRLSLVAGGRDAFPAPLRRLSATRTVEPLSPGRHHLGWFGALLLPGTFCVSWFWLNFLVDELLLSLLFTIVGNFLLLLSFLPLKAPGGRGPSLTLFLPAPLQPTES